MSDDLAGVPGSNAPRPQERLGWKRPRGERESPHPYFVEHERHRVICRECPWFWERLGASYLDLKGMGQRHRTSMREAERP